MHCMPVSVLLAWVPVLVWLLAADSAGRADTHTTPPLVVNRRDALVHSQFNLVLERVAQFARADHVRRAFAQTTRRE